MKLLTTLVIYLSICLVGNAESRLIGIDRFIHIRDDDHVEKREAFIRIDHITEIEISNPEGDEANAIVMVHLKGSERVHTIHFSSRKDADAAALRIRDRIFSLGDKG